MLRNIMKQISVFIFFLITNFVFSQSDSLIYKNSHSMSIYKSKAIYKGKEIFNSKSDEAQFLKDNEEVDNCSVVVDIYRNPLSLIDNYFSYEYYFGSEAACGKYGNDTKVETIDLKTFEKVSLSDLFTEKSIVRALKNDSWVLRTFTEMSLVKELDSVNSFNKMLELLNDIEYDVRFHKQGFVVVDNKMKDGKIGVRFVGSQPISVSYHRKHLQLGLMLVPKSDFKDKLLNKTEFVLGQFRNGLTN